MEPFVLFVSFVVVIQATINQFAAPIRICQSALPIAAIFEVSRLKATINSHSFVSMEACQVRQARNVGSDIGNAGRNPVRRDWDCLC